MDIHARKSLSRCVSLLLLTLGCSLPLCAAQAKTQTRAPAPVAAAVRTTATAPMIRHQQARPLKPSERPSQSSSREHLYSDYDRPERNQSPQMRLHMAAAAAGCDVNAVNRRCLFPHKAGAGSECQLFKEISA